MRVNWNELNYELFREISPKIIQVYFGIDLQFERTYDSERNGAESFVFSRQQEKILGVVQQQKQVNLNELSRLIAKILRMETSAGLIVSASPQPFRFIFLEKAHGCWFPIAIWGRRQIDAIASLNSRLFSRIVPFFERYSQFYSALNKTSLGKGGVLSSDIVEFIQLGISVGLKIGVDPAKARTDLIRDVDRCFVRSGRENADYWQKVGSDGWFHFYKSPSSSQVINLAIDCSNQICQIASKRNRYLGQNLKAVMGINIAENVQLDPSGGGPLDDDSIISIRLLREKFKQYNIRATEKAVLELVDASNQKNWAKYDSFTYPDGRHVEVYGHI